MRGTNYALLAATLLSACSQHSDTTREQSESVLGDSQQTRWDYLAAKYDADGDGVIASTEYGRGEDGFRELDRNGDGSIERAELNGWEEGLAQAMAPRRVQTVVGPMLLARYFDSNGDCGQLSRRELDEVFPSYDADGDGRILPAEFSARLANLGVKVSAEYDPFGEIAKASIGDEATQLTLAELHNFYTVLEQRRTTGYSIRLGEDAPPAPNAVGSIAPDFSLPLLHAEPGDAPVLLSSFRGTKPVALIFGSYT
jgi:Ca2+-binding EF-hand superfamily protein